MLITVIGWLAAAAAIALLARLRGKRGLIMLAVSLLLVVLGVLTWNLIVSSGSGP